MSDLPIPPSIPNWPQVTARAILQHDVDREIAGYLARQQSGNVLWLDLPGLRAAIADGMVRHGPRDLPVPAIDPAFAQRAAVEAIRDGIVIMFVDGKRITDLDESLTIAPDSRVRYLRILAQRGL